ncbi:MAG: hypothetical protein MUE40_19485 [Anaerolineae bacterium]|jgi:uncharacterized repeat protein (TIGR01451 family)|nr:hypothetical protein [Anaerolineae bacterium]
MSIQRSLFFRLLIVLCLGVLAAVTAAAPLIPSEPPAATESPLELNLTGKASVPQLDGTRLEWTITLRNAGSAALENILLVDTLPNTIQLNRMDFQRGQTRIVVDGQTLTMTVQRLEAGATTRITLYTNTGYRGRTITNSVCTQDGRQCASADIILR